MVPYLVWAKSGVQRKWPRRGAAPGTVGCQGKALGQISLRGTFSDQSRDQMVLPFSFTVMAQVRVKLSA